MFFCSSVDFYARFIDGKSAPVQALMPPGASRKGHRDWPHRTCGMCPFGIISACIVDGVFGGILSKLFRQWLTTLRCLDKAKLVRVEFPPATAASPKVVAGLPVPPPEGGRGRSELDTLRVAVVERDLFIEDLLFKYSCARHRLKAYKARAGSLQTTKKRRLHAAVVHNPTITTSSSDESC